MTNAQHTALARLSDGEWRTGREIAAAANVIAALNNAGMIRGAGMGAHGMLDENWTITPDGFRALEMGT